jgi:hypothetical protein
MRNAAVLAGVKGAKGREADQAKERVPGERFRHNPAALFPSLSQALKPLDTALIRDKHLRPQVVLETALRTLTFRLVRRLRVRWN